MVFDLLEEGYKKLVELDEGVILLAADDSDKESHFCLAYKNPRMLLDLWIPINDFSFWKTRGMSWKDDDCIILSTGAL